MRFLLLSLCLLFTPMTLSVPQPAQAEVTRPFVIPDASRQLMLVVSESWSAIPAKLYRYQRSSVESPWQAKGTAIQTVLGRKGMGWGKGLHRPEDTNGDYRVEFDKRAPAGIFTIGEAFGLASESNARKWLGGLKMPYTELTASMRCIGDHESSHYNEIVDIKRTKSDWNDEPNENMRQIAVTDEKAYEWGAFINHNVNSNPQSRDKVSGSCIFLHIWKDAATGTAGCTAMGRADMLALLRWLDSKQQPILVQLPRAEYERLKTDWALPELMP